MTKEQEFIQEINTMKNRYYKCKSPKIRNDLYKCIKQMVRDLKDYQRFKKNTQLRKNML